MKKNHKNVIIISIDNLRSDCVGINPNKELLAQYDLKTQLKTPILDWFVKNGTFFSQCISAAPYTTTSHASILTGMWPKNHKIEHYFRNKLAKPTILEILKKDGFETMIQTDFPVLLGHPLGFSRHVDKFIKFNEEESYVWLKKNMGKRKACFFHFANVHSPFGFSFLGKEKHDLVKKIAFLAKKYDVKLESKILDNKQRIRMQAMSMNKAKIDGKDILRFNYEKILTKLHLEGRYDEIMELYIEGINYFEKNRFSSFMTNLKKLGLFENSIIVIVGDHGEKWGRNMRGHFGGSGVGDMLLDEVIKVPLIFFGKNIPKLGIVDFQVRTIDVVPTLMSLLGINDGFFDGLNLFDVDNEIKKRDAYSQAWNMRLNCFQFVKKSLAKKEFPEHDFEAHLIMDAVRADGYKLIQEYDINGKIKNKRILNIKNGEVELDLAKNSELTKKMQLKLKTMKSVDYNGSKKKTSKIADNNEKKIADELRAMGYNI